MNKFDCAECRNGIARPKDDGRLKNSGVKILGSERGQAMTEYVLLVLLVALVCAPIVRLLPAAIREYVRPFYYCVSRPIP